MMISPDEGKTVQLGGIGVVYKLYGNQTGGTFSIVEHPIIPGTLVPPHVHFDEDELSFVTEGVIGARIGDEVIEATPGCYILKPRGVPHTFWNSTTKPARLVEIISPPGFEQYFEEMAQLLQQDGPPDFERISKLATTYGCAYHMEW